MIFETNGRKCIIGACIAIVMGAFSTHAHAASINCYKDIPPGAIWQYASNDPLGQGNKYIYSYELLSANPTFNVSQTLVSQNALPDPITATFTSSKSESFTSTVSSSLSVSFFKWLTANVSASFTQTITTLIGQSATVPVPAMSSVVGQYGVDAYDITYNVRTLMMTKSQNFYFCFDLGNESRTSNVPTTTIRWRFSPG